ncbi:hypothetical protein SCALM49S_00762 [Streptomyces californicus]
MTPQSPPPASDRFIRAAIRCADAGTRRSPPTRFAAFGV